MSSALVDLKRDFNIPAEVFFRFLQLVPGEPRIEFLNSDLRRRAITFHNFSLTLANSPEG